jgi:hypothetical protein
MTVHKNSAYVVLYQDVIVAQDLALAINIAHRHVKNVMTQRYVHLALMDTQK